MRVTLAIGSSGPDRFLSSSRRRLLQEVPMIRARIPRPSPAIVIACLALAVALSGTGYAALKIPVRSVGTTQLKDNAVTTKKVANNSLLRVASRRARSRAVSAPDPRTSGGGLELRPRLDRVGDDERPRGRRHASLDGAPARGAGRDRRPVPLRRARRPADRRRLERRRRPDHRGRPGDRDRPGRDVPARRPDPRRRRPLRDAADPVGARRPRARACARRSCRARSRCVTPTRSAPTASS